MEKKAETAEKRNEECLTHTVKHNCTHLVIYKLIFTFPDQITVKKRSGTSL